MLVASFLLTQEGRPRAEGAVAARAPSPRGGDQGSPLLYRPPTAGGRSGWVDRPAPWPTGEAVPNKGGPRFFLAVDRLVGGVKDVRLHRVELPHEPLHDVVAVLGQMLSPQRRDEHPAEARPSSAPFRDRILLRGALTPVHPGFDHDWLLPVQQHPAHLPSRASLSARPYPDRRPLDGNVDLPLALQGRRQGRASLVPCGGSL